MQEVKINKENDAKSPSKESIEKYKNFSHLSHEYDRLTKRPKVPLYKDKKMFLMLLLIVLVAYLVSEAVSEEKKDLPIEKIDKPFIDEE